VESVKSILNQLNLPFEKVGLGEAKLLHPLEEKNAFELKERLRAVGFELLEDKKAKIVEKVKNLIFELIDRQEEHKSFKLSDYISRNIGYDYSHISGMFTESQGSTIERFMIVQKIERAKELLSYQELNLNEIADRLHYSSSAALSAQFKEVTGMTPTEFRKEPQRRSLDEVV
jgi:AraC-like DNA-binding protein